MFKLIVNGKNGHEESDFQTEQECIDHHQNNLEYWGEHTYEIVSMSQSLDDISPRQIRLALLSLGITEGMVDGAINNLPSPSKEQAMIAWKFSTSFVRSYEAIDGLGAAIGLNPAQLDQLWTLGKSL